MKKQEFAIKLLFLLLPWHVSRNLPTGLLRAMFGDSLAPQAGWPPWTFPPDWTPPDPLPPALSIEPGAPFPPGWTPADPLPPGVSIVPGAPFPPGWTPGTPLLSPPSLPSPFPPWTLDPGGSHPYYPPGHPAPQPSEYQIISNTSDAWLRNINKITWSLARNSAYSDSINALSPSYTYAIQAERIAALYHCARSFLDFNLSPIPPSKTITSATLSLTTTGPYAHTICIQQGTQTIPMSTAQFQAFTGPLFAIQTTIIGLNTITLNAPALAYLQSVLGSTAKLSLREYNYDYLNVAPGPPFGRVGIYFADTPSEPDKPTLTITTT